MLLQPPRLAHVRIILLDDGRPRKAHASANVPFGHTHGFNSSDGPHPDYLCWLVSIQSHIAAGHPIRWIDQNLRDE